MLETADFDPMAQTALLVGIERHGMAEGEAEGLLEELAELVVNLGIRPIERCVVRLREPHAAFLTGTGKTDELLAMAKELQVDCLIFDEALSPAQQRNWEQRAGGKLLVIDRQEVILDIFNSRAQTKEARLQVELARLEYELPRMKRAWSHLDRQRGGGAVQRDAGESQLELDQRMIRTRIARLKRELETVVRQRDVQRRRRDRIPVPSAAIVGYTNAGKSTLLNRLCATAEVLSADQLFATLDPTTRRCRLPSGQLLLLTDTVGFIRRLPHRLVEAFKATLEEALRADLLIHVIDGSSPDAVAHAQTTRAVLEELDVNDKPTLTVLNKADCGLSDPVRVALANEVKNALPVSAATGLGLDELLGQCDSELLTTARPTELLVPYQRYELVNALHEAGAVDASEARAEGTWLRGFIPPRLKGAVAPFQLNGS
ncbi:MAG: GTPase HflX [Opitutales bacterium]